LFDKPSNRILIGFAVDQDGFLEQGQAHKVGAGLPDGLF
jgi:hypothetical protein